jgi:hypothetical protein
MVAKQKDPCRRRSCCQNDAEHRQGVIKRLTFCNKADQRPAQGQKESNQQGTAGQALEAEDAENVKQRLFRM